MNRYRMASAVIGLSLAVLLAGCNQSASPNNGGPIGSSAEESAAAVQPSPSETTNNEKKKPGSPQSESLLPPKTGDSSEPAPAPNVATDETKESAPEGKEVAIAESTPEPEAVSKPKPSASPAATVEPVQVETTPTPSASPKPSKQPSATPAPTPAPKTEKVVWDGDNVLTFANLYAKQTVRGFEFSDQLKALDGKEVEMTGFMAPPLTADVTFFVLTKIPLAVCPFCSSDADWPNDIVVVYMPDGKEVKATEHTLTIKGTLSIGPSTDEETGFYSLIRIMADKIEVQK